MIGIFYATGKGDTQKACEYAAAKFGDEVKVIKAVKDVVQSNEFEGFDLLILASSSYGFGELHEDWKAKLGLLKEANLKGKKVALIGVGNQERHGDNFCGGIVEFLPFVKGASLLGAKDKDGYKFDYSSAFINGKFIGLVLDTKGDKEYEKRIDKWASDIKAQI
ncbi:flavodoxin domain-containing protein [Campylobacter sp. RM16188]|uniref:flavodoxin domain-containing protein n=1 Tax=Campylobacter sp. RM16188 TaxID=1705725 RepID=UPI0015556C62|nr:flavodoxin domain-containing protein [Campylobacter sp. RM16188]